MSTLRERIRREILAEIEQAPRNQGRVVVTLNLTVDGARDIAAALERQGEEPQFDKNRGYTEPQVNEGACDVCDMRWTGYGTRCPVCEGEGILPLQQEPDAIDRAAMAGAVRAQSRKVGRVVLDPIGEPSIPKQEIRRAVREQQGER